LSSQGCAASISKDRRTPPKHFGLEALNGAQRQPSGRCHWCLAVAVHIAVCCVIGFASAALMPDFTGKDISAEYDD
jgi:hypothetical protein